MGKKEHYKSAEIKQRLTLPICIVFGVELAFCFAVHWFIGGLLLIATIGILFIRTGLEIDNKAGRMRNYINLFGVEVGGWRKTPELSYISVVRVKLKRKSFQASSDMYVQTSSNKVKYNVNLITEDRRQRFIKILTAEKNKCIDEALKIGDILDLKVLDYTTPNEKWIR